MMNTPTMTQPIKIAILAMGGEGGGVLADWIVDLGEQNGHIAQTTSVPGVAQRTGATIYYVELYPRAQAEADGAEPVLALMPLPGDVDVVLASELMEAGRAVQRGLVAADRTTLVASTHRVYSIAEKSALGDGRVDSRELIAHADAAALRFVRFDMAALAERTGSVISSVLFGALAATGVLPFRREDFEATIRRGGVGVEASLRAFAAAYEEACREPVSDAAAPAAAAEPSADVPGSHPHPVLHGLLQRVAKLPAAARGLAFEGVKRLVDYQDPAYAALYLDRLDTLPTTPDGALAAAAARHLALWMAYDDTARVAELKTRGSRFQRVRGEVKAQAGQVMDIEEYLHPRLQEICDTLPAGLGRWLQSSGAPRRWVERLTQRGRIVRTSSLGGFLMLRAVASAKRWRRASLRYQHENTRIEDWLADVRAVAGTDPQLAVELVACQRLVKGYSDTHERGLQRFETVMAAARQQRGRITPLQVRELREAALGDEQGRALQAALQRLGLPPSTTTANAAAPLKEAVA